MPRVPYPCTPPPALLGESQDIPTPDERQSPSRDRKTNLTYKQDNEDGLEPMTKRQKLQPEYKQKLGIRMELKLQKTTKTRNSTAGTVRSTRRFSQRPHQRQVLKNHLQQIDFQAMPLINGGPTSASQTRVAENGLSSANIDCDLDTEINFTPEKIPLFRNILYRFRCPSSGTFRCSSTRLVFVVTKEAELQYRIISWEEAFVHSLSVNEKEKKVVPLLQTLGRTPAGPLYDIECPERAVCELHLPHCEAETADLSKSQLSVAHFSDTDIDSIEPVRITDSHVVIKVTELSPYGLTNPSEQNERISGQVLLFRTPKNWDVIKLNVFLLPRNVPLETVKCKQLSTTQIIDAPSACELVVKEFYSVVCPLAEIVQPKSARFDMDYEPNYSPLFELRLSTETTKASVQLQQTGNREETEVWSHDVYLTDPTCKVPRASPRKRLLNKLALLRPKFVEKMSDPVLNQLLDKLLAKRYLNEQERERASEKNRADKARDLVDTVIKKGSRAAEYFIKTFCELDQKSDLSRRMRRILPSKQ